MGLYSRKSAWLVAAAAMSLVCLVAHDVLVDVQMERMSAQYMTQSELDALIADQRLVAASGIFRPTAGPEGTDAGPTLNRFLPLDGGDQATATPLEFAPWSGKQIREQVKGPRSKHPRAKENQPWLTRPEALPEMDLTILEALLGHGSWDQSSPPGRYHDYLETGARPLLFNSDIPNMIDLMTLAKLRLAEGLRSEDMLPALREVRHLASLSLHVEELVATMVGVALLKIERRAYTRALELGLLSPEDWTPASKELTDAMRRLGLSMVVVASGWTEPDALVQIQEAVPAPFGLCSGLRDAVSMWSIAYPIWSGLPFERDVASQLTTLRDRVDKASACQARLVRDELAHPERMSMSEWRKSIAAVGTAPPLWATAPFIRVHWILNELTNGTPMTGYNQYRKSGVR